MLINLTLHKYLNCFGMNSLEALSFLFYPMILMKRLKKLLDFKRAINSKNKKILNVQNNNI